jgi:hypothetical protein
MKNITETLFNVLYIEIIRKQNKRAESSKKGAFGVPQSFPSCTFSTHFFFTDQKQERFF